MRKLNFMSLIFMALAVALSIGCDGNSKGGPVIPPILTTLEGTLVAPARIESSLLPAILESTDTTVRNAFEDAQVYVNGYRLASFTLDAPSGAQEWPLKLYNVPESANQKYLVEVVVNKVILKSWVRSSEKSNFSVNIESTAAAMLSEAFGKDQHDLIASYPFLVNSLKTDLTAAFLKTASQLGNNTTLATEIVNKVNGYKTLFTALNGIESNAKLAYLQQENDLDGDGVSDFFVRPNGDNTRIRFSTALSSYTSMIESVQSLEDYSNNALLQDFADNSLSDLRYFSQDAKNIALGIFFKTSASADVYIKLFIHRVDLVDGAFKGVAVEYCFVETLTTALLSGTTTLMLSGETPSEGAVVATDFINSGAANENRLMFVSSAAGIGCFSGNVRLVKAIDGQPDLEKLSFAEKYTPGTYFVNTTLALQAIYQDRPLENGDVFSAYFPDIQCYALFKIKQIGSDRITVDYKINTSKEARFK